MSLVSGQGVQRSGRRAADDSGSLIETATALVVMSMASIMVLTFNVTSSRVRQQAEIRSAAVALIERYSAAARQIDCVQNAGLLEVVCGPEPDAADGNKVIKPAGADESNGESGHDDIRIEWADYYQLADMTACTSDKVPPRAVREITAEWTDGTGGQKETRLVLGPRVPLSRGWTAVSASAATPPLPPGRQEFTYDPTRETVQVATYGGGTSRCRVLVAPPGKTVDDPNANSPKECKLDVGWQDPGTWNSKTDAAKCLW